MSYGIDSNWVKSVKNGEIFAFDFIANHYTQMYFWDIKKLAEEAVYIICDNYLKGEYEESLIDWGMSELSDSEIGTPFDEIPDNAILKELVGSLSNGKYDIVTYINEHYNSDTPTERIELKRITLEAISVLTDNNLMDKYCDTLLEYVFIDETQNDVKQNNKKKNIEVER